MPPSFGFYEPYALAVREAGGIPLICARDFNPTYLDSVYDIADGFIFTGGEDIDPNRYGILTQPPNAPEDDPRLRPDRTRDDVENYLARRILSRPKPTLAICRGLEVFNVVAGGRIEILKTEVEHFRADSERDWRNYAHYIDIVPGTLLADLLDGMRHMGVNSLHHMGIRHEKDLAEEFTPSAFTVDDASVEAFEFSDRSRGFFLAVQFHPEMLYNKTEPRWNRLFHALVEEAGAV